MAETGRPVSTGSVTSRDGASLVYLHAKRLEKIAGKVAGRDGLLLIKAAEAMRALSKKNRELGRKVGNYTPRMKLAAKGASFPVNEAATGVCELAADGPVVAYLFRGNTRVRVTVNETLPRGAKRIGRFDIASDFREVETKIKQAVAK